MIGKTISHYKIVEELGRGGMGVVYRAEDTKLKRTVALKFLPPTEAADDRIRFEQEAQSAAHLQHPNICTIHQIDEVDGQVFIVMAMIDGVELKALTARGSMALNEAVSVAVQVAMALEEAHEHHIIHRDIKSANVMINRKGLAKVMDFGLAKRRGRTQITQAGTSMGTIDYMSPEQSRGDEVDHRTDVWAYGVMLYEMVAGQMPFRGEFDQAVIYSILNEEPAPLTTVRAETPPLLSDIVARAMAKNPDDRYQSMTDLLVDLHEVQAEVGVPAGTSVTGAINWAAAGKPSTGGKSAATPRPTHAQAGEAGEAGRSADGVNSKSLRTMGAYAILAAAVIIGLHWLVNKFPLSPHLPSFGLWAFLALLPAVAVVAFFRSNKVRAVGIPVTLIAAAALLFFMFGDKDLGAATKMVTVTDEDGNEIERAIPKSEFRKRVALFYFDNDSGDPANDWVSYGIAQMLRMDLSQDTYINLGMGFTRPHQEGGFDPPVGSPTMFKNKLAQDYHYQRFVTGSFDRMGEETEVTLSLHRTGDASVIATRRYRGANLFALADTMSVQLRRDLGIPDYHIAESVDLPVAEMFTGSLEAMEEYVNGVNARWQDNDYNAAVEHLKGAISKDPAFAMAHLEVFGAYLNLNDGKAAEAAVRSALQHKYKLPERTRYSLMSAYHETREDAESVLMNAKRWVSLYPDDVDAHLKLAQYYEERANDIEAAIAERKLVFEISPERYTELHAIAGLYEDMGDIDNAEFYLNEYAGLFPDKYDSYTALGAFYRRRGDFENARRNYRQALVIEPERMSIRTQLAGIERQTGNFDESLRQCTQALESAQTAQDSSTALQQLFGHHMFRGEAARALDYQQAMYREQDKFMSPLNIMIARMFTLGTYVDAGRTDEAFAILKDAAAMPAVPWFRSFVAAGYIIIYGHLDDAGKADQSDRHLQSFADWVNQSGMHQLDWVIDFCSAISLNWREENEEARERIGRALETAPRDATDNLIWMNRVAGKIAREMGNYAEAEGFLNDALKLEPWSPDIHYELALLFQEQGRGDKAREHIEKAMQVWEDADSTVRRAQKARELADLLRESS